MSIGDWPSDGILALLGLVMYGILLLTLVIRRLRDFGQISRYVPAALLWHGIVFAFVSFWMLPHYAAGSGADAVWYHSEGMRTAELIRAGDWANISWGLGTDTIPLLTGLLYAPFGGNMYGLLFFSGVLGFSGALYLCRAFSLWISANLLKAYILIILFLPSLATWTSLAGKDSWVALGLGMAAFGYASILRARALSGLWHLFAGLVIITLIRPHISLMLAASMAFAYIWGLTQRRRGSMFIKLAMVVLLVAMSGALLTVASKFLGLAEISAESVEANLDLHGQGNAVGGSTVEIQQTRGPIGMLLAFPRGIVRVLLEPFPWEVNGFNSGLASAENLFILWFALNNARRMRALFRGIARQPYLLFSSTFAFLLLFMLSFTPNLGLLSRQRAQLLPFLFVPLAAAGATRKGRMVNPADMPLRAEPRFSRGNPLIGPHPLGHPNR